MKYLFCLAAATVLTIAGCGNSGSRRSADGGGITLGDSGGIMLMDSGPRTDSGGMTGTDAGGMRECESMFMPYPTEAGMRCSAETRTCIQGCTDPATANMCINTCIDADTTTPVMTMSGLTIDCGFCIAYNQFYCLDSMGCHAQVAAYNCCIEDNGCMDQACVNTNCAPQISALNSCFMSTAPGCADITAGPYAVCYP